MDSVWNQKTLQIWHTLSKKIETEIFVSTEHMGRMMNAKILSVLQATGFFPKHVWLSLPPTLYQKNVYLNIVPSPQALLLFTDLKKWHRYFSSKFFKATIVQLNYWIHLYLIVLLVLMCYWTTFLSEAVSFPCNTENLRLYQGNILHGQDKVSLVLFIACWNLIRRRYAGFKNALPGTLYFLYRRNCFYCVSLSQV